MRVPIEARQRDIILAIEEDHFHDLKAKEIKPSKLAILFRRSQMPVEVKSSSACVRTSTAPQR
jgi:hypothetical protein